MSQITLQVLKESFKEGKITIDWGHKRANIKEIKIWLMLLIRYKMSWGFSMTSGGQKGGGTVFLITLLLTN